MVAFKRDYPDLTHQHLLWLLTTQPRRHRFDIHCCRYRRSRSQHPHLYKSQRNSGVFRDLQDSLEDVSRESNHLAVSPVWQLSRQRFLHPKQHYLSPEPSRCFLHFQSSSLSTIRIPTLGLYECYIIKQRYSGIERSPKAVHKEILKGQQRIN